MTQAQWLLRIHAITAGLFGTALHLALMLAFVASAASAQPSLEPNQSAAPAIPSGSDDLQAKATEAMANQNWAVAEDLLLQAQHTLHRQHGVVTERQAPILDQLARAHIAQKDYRQANRLKEFNHFLGQRSASLDTQVQAEIALARWYLYSGEFDAARRLLSTSLKAELARRPFVPERALLRLDIELFSARCCQSDEAIALLALAKTQDLPADLIAQFEQRVGDLLILDGQATLAAEHYAQQITMVGQMPQLISGLQRYDDLDHKKTGDMKLRQELRRRRMLAGGYPDEALWSEAPQIFTVASSEDFLPIAETAQSELGGSTDHFEPVVGTPFRFNLEQLRQALPSRYRTLARLETLEVQMTLDVTVQGKPTNIRFEDNYPRQIRDLMKKVLKVARFRPAIRDGYAVETLDMPFVQRFKTPASPSKGDV